MESAVQNSPYQAPESDVSTEQTLSYAGFWIRVVATLIDTFLLMVVIFPLLIAIYGTDYFLSDAMFLGVWDVLINYVLPAVVVILFWVSRGATPGKMAVGAKIVDARSGEKLTTGQCIGRYFAYFISMIPLLLGYIWVGIDQRKQGWHDKLAGTVVVRNSKGANPVTFSG